MLDLTADEKTIEDFENAALLIHKNLMYVAYVLGAKIPKYQDQKSFPIDKILDILNMGLYENCSFNYFSFPSPVEKLDNSEDPSIFKNIDLLLLKKKTIQPQNQEILQESQFNYSKVQE